MFLDDKNILHDVQYRNEDDGWVRGNLANLAVECAHYSKLAASTVSNGQQSFICLYYQKNEFHGPITMVSYSELNATWVKGKPDMTLTPPATPAPPPTYRDPPMYGTSMTAVKPRSGIGPRSQMDDKLPVLFLQWDTHSIAHARGDGRYRNVRILCPSLTCCISYWTDTGTRAVHTVSPHQPYSR